MTSSETQPERKSARDPALHWAGFALLVFGFVLIRFFPGHSIATFLRWGGLAILSFVAVRKRSLTFGIFLSMLIGLETGLDWPVFASRLKILSDIFLRL